MRTVAGSSGGAVVAAELGRRHITHIHPGAPIRLLEMTIPTAHYVEKDHI